MAEQRINPLPQFLVIAAFGANVVGAFAGLERQRAVKHSLEKRPSRLVIHRGPPCSFRS